MPVPLAEAGPKNESSKWHASQGISWLVPQETDGPGGPAEDWVDLPKCPGAIEWLKVAVAHPIGMEGATLFEKRQWSRFDETASENTRR